MVWLYFLISFLLTFLLTPLTIQWAKKVDLVTDSKDPTHPAHTHTGRLPRAGGLPIFLGIFGSLSLVIFKNQILTFVFFGAVLILIVGLLDDKYNLSPYWRFLANIFSAALAVLGRIGIPYLSSPFAKVIHLDAFVWQLSFLNHQYTLLWLADLVAILWIVWCMNMINWSKGVDGQMPGFVVIAAVFLSFLAWRFSRHEIPPVLVASLALATAGAFLGFLPWNFYPQKIMPGYSAGTLAGYLLSICAILAWGKFDTLTLILILPFTDAVVVFLRRIKEGRSPFRADRTHFHHSLLDLGWSRRRIAVFYWLITFIAGMASFLISGQYQIYTVLLLILFFSGVIVITHKAVAKNS